MSQNHGMVAAGHQQTAQAGQEMFALGGNAFDAAIAAVLASFVVESTLASVAGGGFLLAHTQDHQDILFDFFCQTPLIKRSPSEINFYPVDVHFGGEKQTFQIGMGSMAVPGSIAGVFEVHKKLGRLPFSVVAEPAIESAKNGFVLNKFQSYCCQILEPILLATPESRKLYAPNGSLLTAGETSCRKELADTLSELAQAGGEAFYRGEIGRKLIQDCRNLGGYLTLEDLKNYRVIQRSPLRINYRGYKLLTNPPPSSGGTLIAFALKLLSSVDFKSIEFGSVPHYQLLAQVMRLTNQARKEGYDAYLYEEDIAQKFLSQARSKAKNLDPNQWGSTTHISVIDSEGNAASVTTSNGEGSGYVIPNTGVMLNNMLGEADLNPFGFHNWLCDRRLSSMMSPTIVLKEGHPEIVLGSGGSNRIRTAILQVISNLIDFNFSIEQAVEQPRVHWENNIFSVEPPIEGAIANFPDSTLVMWPEKNMFFGGVHAVRSTADRRLEGAGDSRREGVAIG